MMLMFCCSNGDEGTLDECQDFSRPLTLSETSPTTFKYTYRVHWNVSTRFLAIIQLLDCYIIILRQESSTPWVILNFRIYSFWLIYCQATRWDNYLHIFDPRIHWFSLINSTIIVFFLCFMVAMILWRNVSRDVCVAFLIALLLLKVH